MSLKYYTGVGSRKTPKEILTIMTKIANLLYKKNYILRSGGAKGADYAFEIGCGNKKEIYYADNANIKSMEIASKSHPYWNSCSNYEKKLLGRNSFQVLGKKLNNPSDFLICWTPDACDSHDKRSIKTGGTGTAISIANHYNVPIYNLKNEKHLTFWLKQIEFNNI